MIPLVEMSHLAGRIFPCVNSHGVFHLACRDEILLLALAKRAHFSHATQLFNDFGVYLYLQKKHCFSKIFDTFYQHKVK